MNASSTRNALLARSLTLCVVAALQLAPAQAQQAIDHSSHGGHSMHQPVKPAPAKDHGGMDHGDEPMDHSQMNHGEMDHGAMGHGEMNPHSQPTPPPTGVPPDEQTRPPVPTVRPADFAATFPELPEHRMHQGGMNYLFVADELEWQDADEGSALAWDLNGWLGGDIDRLAFRSEGERINGHTEEAELQLLWSHAIDPWWESLLGVRQDFEPGSPQTWAALGVQGMPLYGLETKATAFLGEGGQTALRLEAEYDILLTQRWVLQPTAELNLHGRNDDRRGVGSGLSDAEMGLRLRYEISRQFAPYVGVSWHRAYGNTADMRRADDEDDSETRLVAGIRFWF